MHLKDSAFFPSCIEDLKLSWRFSDKKILAQFCRMEIQEQRLTHTASQSDLLLEADGYNFHLKNKNKKTFGISRAVWVVWISASRMLQPNMPRLSGSWRPHFLLRLKTLLQGTEPNLACGLLLKEPENKQLLYDHLSGFCGKLTRWRRNHILKMRLRDWENEIEREHKCN